MHRRDDHLDDTTVETLLSGRSPAPDSGLGELAGVLAEMTTSFQPDPDPAVAERHLGAMFTAADELGASDGPIGSPIHKPHRRNLMLKSLTSGLALKIGLGLGATALVAGGVALVDNVGDSSPNTKTVATDRAGDDNLDPNVMRLVAAAGAAQDDYRAACEKHVKELSSEMRSALDRVAAEHPDLASSMPELGEGTPGSACTVDWRTFVHDVCTTAVDKRPEPSAEVLDALPKGLRPLVIDPCNAEWSKVDWGKVMSDFDPSAMMRTACKALADGNRPADDKGAADDKGTVQGTGDLPSIGGTYEFSMGGLGFGRLCDGDFDLSGFGDFLNELDWKSLLQGRLPSEEEIDRLRETLDRAGEPTPQA